MVRPRSILPGSAMGDSLVTVTVSVMLPTLSVTFTTADWPADSVSPCCSNFLKPWSSAETRYGPRGSSGAR